ncbi:N-terminal double-transmembrane domain-containing protein [Owenweeksia hongkongensis DSM 17368]|uniref:N-terminal double-transmembrane domain-containing protein n=1 Tax=Owenweeksia hongkongensis (strain DSM 17368 / CIP 108786 / JCM 12287 / NRRL B-23963 / UST20020801) TaxID=926562 RepID=G8R8X8_OWEHD|nr:VWA domain-containing protein [Owenweeksia hongkongensis]AEV33586.1 N-terminal double-transmembrane domain-containing protein [Owenweeksia hongkongensis DSM 17368]
MLNYQFENIEFLWLLLIIPFLVVWQWFKNKQQSPELKFPGASLLAAQGANWLAKLRPLLYALRLIAIALVIVAMARPRTSEENSKTKSAEGIDIVMAIDVSTSMLSRDLRPNRLEATKKVASDFIQERPNDRIGMVVYAGESYTQTPLTSDHKIILNTMKDIKNGLIQDGTAIGMGLATAVNRLKESKAKSKVIILLTDGENNAGNIDPMTAAQLAEEFKIRAYTIGVGTKGTAPTPYAYDMRGNLMYRNLPVNIDEELLKNIADQTGGKYFRATDNDKLNEIYGEIDKLERTKLQELKFYSYDEKFENFALAALILFALELLLRFTVYRSFI